MILSGLSLVPLNLNVVCIAFIASSLLSDFQNIFASKYKSYKSFALLLAVPKDTTVCNFSANIVSYGYVCNVITS